MPQSSPAGRSAQDGPPIAEIQPRGTITNAAWNTLGTLFAIAIAFFTAPILINSLGTAQYGIFLLIGSVTGILSIMNVGLGEATLRYVARYYGDRDLVGVNRVFGSTLSFYAVVSVVVAFALLIGAPVVVTWFSVAVNQHDLVSDLLRLAVLAFAIRIVTSPFMVIPSALQRYDISSKIGIGVNIARACGFMALASLGFGLRNLVLWDFILSVITMALWVTVVRRILPGLKVLPSFSFSGLRETVGYGIFSFLTWAVHTLHRESGKLLLGRFLGAAPVAYFGTPDSVAQHIHLVVARGSEALIPKFSSNRDPKAGETLFWNALWAALALSLVLLVPFSVLVPDFLRLWINPEFAKASGVIGQLIGLQLIAQGAFAPVATYFRGIGKPWFVTLVILGALLITVVMSLQLIPLWGVEAVGYAYFGGAIAPLLGVILGGIFAFGRSAVPILVRVVGLPLCMGSAAGGLGLLLRRGFGEVGWFGLIGLAICIFSLTMLCVVGSDLLLGGAIAPSKLLLGRVTADRRYKALMKLIPVRLGTST